MISEILLEGLSKKTNESSRRSLIIPDCHIPFENKKSYELMLEVGLSVDPVEIVILGDYADFFDVTTHSKELDIQAKLIDEVDAVMKRLRELRTLFKKSKIIYIEGNHEYRLGRYIRDRAKELFGLVSVPYLLNLSAYEIDFVPYGPNQKYHVLGLNSLIARHEPIAGGTNVAYNTVVKAMKSVIFGHVHRIQEAQVVAINGDNYRGITPGWLGDVESPAFEYVKNHHQWAHGFSVVTQVGQKTWFNQTAHIIDRKCQMDGKIFKV